MKVGEVCMKIAGRDAGKVCAVVSVEKDGFVTIDGATRRRKCNPLHLESFGKFAKLKSGAKHEDVVKALKTEGYDLVERKTKKKETKVRQVKSRVVKSSEKAKKAVAKPVKKVVKKKAAKK